MRAPGGGAITATQQADLAGKDARARRRGVLTGLGGGMAKWETRDLTPDAGFPMQ